MKKPERRIRGVINTFFLPLRKHVWDETIANVTGECAQDVTGFEPAAGAQSQSFETDHRVATPIGEPVVPRDDGADFIAGGSSAMILGDNIFYGHNLQGTLAEASSQDQGATIFAYHVRDPERYGVVAFDHTGRATSLAAMGLAMLVAGLAKTETQVAVYGALLVLVLAAVSGTLMPRDLMPENMRQFSYITPHAWALDAYAQLLLNPVPEIAVVAQACGIKETFDISDKLGQPEFVARVRKLATNLFARVSIRADEPPRACRLATASISKRDFATPSAPKLDRGAGAGCKLASRFTPIEGPHS